MEPTGSIWDEVPQEARPQPPALPEGQERTGSILDEIPQEQWPAEKRLGHILHKNARADQPFEAMGAELKQAMPGLEPDQFKDYYKRLGPALKLEEAHKAIADSPETTSSWLSRHVLPGGSALIHYKQARNYADAKKRYDEGNPEPDDYATIAGYEKIQETEQNQGLMGKLGSSVAKIPAIAGEFAAGGAALKGLGQLGAAGARAVGLMAPAAATAQVAVPTFMASSRIAQLGAQAGMGLGKAALITPLVPSMYVEKWLADNQKNGRDPADLKGLPAAYAMGTLQVAVLGGIAKAGGSIPGSSTGAWASRVLRGTETGLAGQQAVDIAGSALSKLLPKEYELTHGYGLAGNLLRGEYGELGQHLTVQAVTFAAFSMLHAHNDPEVGQSEMERYAATLRTMKDRGLNPTILNHAYDTLADVVAKNPDPTRAQVAEAMRQIPEGPVRDYGLDMAAKFPDRAETAPSASSPLPPTQPGQPPPAPPAPPPQAPQVPTAKRLPPEAIQQIFGGELGGEAQPPARLTEPPAPSKGMRPKPEKTDWFGKPTEEEAQAAEKEIQDTGSLRVADHPELNRPAPAKPAESPVAGSVHEAALQAFPEAKISPYDPNRTIAKVGDAMVFLEHDPVRNVVRIDFDRSTTGVQKAVQEGSKDLMHSLKSLVSGLAEKGYGIEYRAIDTNRPTGGLKSRAELYAKWLKKAGYEETPESGKEGMFSWKPKEPATEEAQGAQAPWVEYPRSESPISPAEATKAIVKEMGGGRNKVAPRTNPAEPSEAPEAKPEQPKSLDDLTKQAQGGKTASLDEVMQAADLTPAERHIVQQRISGRSHESIAADEPMLKKDGNPYSRQRIKQIEQSAMEKLGLPSDYSLATLNKQTQADNALEMAERGERVNLTDLKADPAEVKQKGKVRLDKYERRDRAMERLMDDFIKESESGELSAERKAHYERSFAKIQTGKSPEQGEAQEPEGVPGGVAGRGDIEPPPVRPSPGGGLSRGLKAPGPADAEQRVEGTPAPHPEGEPATSGKRKAPSDIVEASRKALEKYGFSRDDVMQAEKAVDQLSPGEKWSHSLENLVRGFESGDDPSNPEIGNEQKMVREHLQKVIAARGTLPESLKGPPTGKGQGGAGGKEISQHEIIATMKKLFGLPIYPGAEEASYNLHNESVELPDMRAGEAPLVTHELAHQIAKQYKLPLDPNTLPPEVVRGFQQFDYQSNRANIPEAMQEGFAEWLRMRSTDRLQINSPEQRAADKWAEGQIRDKGLTKELDRIHGLFKQYNAQTPMQQYAGLQSHTGKSAQPILTPGEKAADFASRTLDAKMTQLLDDLIPIKTAEKVAMSKGAKFAPGTKLSEVAAVNRLSSVPMAQDFQQGGMNKIVSGKQVQTGRPLAEIVGDVDAETLEKVVGPMMDARQKLYQATLAGGAKNFPVHELDMAEAAMREFKARPDAGKLTKIADALSKEIFDASLDSMVADGRISPVAAAKWKAENSIYAPMKRILGEEGAEPGVRKPGAGSRGFMKERTGESGEQTIGLTQAIQERYLTTARVRNQQAKFNALMDLASREGVGEFLSPGKRGPKGEVLGVEQSDHGMQISGFKGGEPIHLPINSKTFFEAYNGTQGEGTVSQSFLKGLGDLFQWTRIPQTIRAGGAALSWLYHLKSPIRDPIVAMQRTVADGNPFSNLADLGVWWGKSFSWYWRALLAGGSDNVEVKQASDRMFQWMEQKAGRQMDIGAESGQRTFASRAMSGWHGLYQRITDLLGAGERGTRVWEAKNVLLKEFGITPEKMHEQLNLDPALRDPIPYAAQIKALDIAQQITHNVHQMGSQVRELNRAWPFLGAHIAGAYKDVSNAIAQPGKAAAGLAILAAAKTLEWLVNKEDKEYQEIAPHLRTGFVFKTPLGWMHLPAPRGLNQVVTGMLGESLRYASQSNPKFGAMVQHSIEEILPHGGPEPVTTGIHMAANRSWTGQPIIPDREADKMSMGERMRDPRGLKYAASQLTGGMLDRNRASLNPFRMDQHPHQSVNDWRDAYDAAQTQHDRLKRQGLRDPREREYQILHSIEPAMSQLSKQLKDAPEERVALIRQRQIELAKGALGALK